MTSVYEDRSELAETLSSSDSTSNKSEDSDILREQAMFLWNKNYEKWHECIVAFSPPMLYITEKEDYRFEVCERQLLHLQQKWFHGDITRREAKYILHDFNGGNGSFLVRTSESFPGRYAISFLHENRAKHIVIESKPDPVAGVLYNITPSGPVFSSLYDIIEKAQQQPLITNHSLHVTLGKCPPKPDMTWLHRGVKSLSHAECILKKEQREGAFFVYKTQSEYAPYIVVYRSGGSIQHSLIVATEQPTAGFTLNNVMAPVLYKLIHYFMENPISGRTVLKHPVVSKDPTYTNCGIALKEHNGDRASSELSFQVGALVTNILSKGTQRSVGDHRGDKCKQFPSDYVRLLKKDELAFVNELRNSVHPGSSLPSITLNIRGHYRTIFNLSEQHGSIIIQPCTPTIKNSLKTYRLSCSSREDLEQWFYMLQGAHCLPMMAVVSSSSKRSKAKRNDCVIC